jgi:hypothetical protein
LNRLVTKPLAESITLAKALAEAAALPSRLPTRRALVTVLFRSDILSDDLRVQGAGLVLLSTYFAARLATAGAHADKYGLFPVGILQAISLDLVESLQSLIELLVDAAAPDSGS